MNSKYLKLEIEKLKKEVKNLKTSIKDEKESKAVVLKKYEELAAKYKTLKDEKEEK